MLGDLVLVVAPWIASFITRYPDNGEAYLLQCNMDRKPVGRPWRPRTLQRDAREARRRYLALGIRKLGRRLAGPMRRQAVPVRS